MAMLLLLVAGISVTAAPLTAGASGANATVAYVTNFNSSTVSPINLSTGTVGKPIPVPLGPTQAALSSNGKTLYVVSFGSDESGGGAGITPINLATQTAGKQIAAGSPPVAIAVSPVGSLAYVLTGYQPCCDNPAGKLPITPINTTSNAAGPPVQVGANAVSMSLTPNGKTLFVVNADTTDSATSAPPEGITVIGTATNTVKAQLHLAPVAIAITPNGKTAYAIVQAAMGDSLVVPINTTTFALGKSIVVGLVPMSIAISPSGKTAYVLAVPDSPGKTAAGEVSHLIPINTATNKEGKPIAIKGLPTTTSPPPAISPNGKLAYVVVDGAGPTGGAVVPVNLVTGKAGKEIRVLNPAAIAVAPSGKAAYVVSDGNRVSDGTVIPISTSTNKAGKAITVGVYPLSITFGP